MRAFHSFFLFWIVFNLVALPVAAVFDPTQSSVMVHTLSSQSVVEQGVWARITPISHEQVFSVNENEFGLPIDTLVPPVGAPLDMETSASQQQVAYLFTHQVLILELLLWLVILCLAFLMVYSFTYARSDATMPLLVADKKGGLSTALHSIGLAVLVLLGVSIGMAVFSMYAENRPSSFDPDGGTSPVTGSVVASVDVVSLNDCSSRTNATCAANPCCELGGFSACGFVDDDSDNVCDAEDNCVEEFNPGQVDTDADGVGGLFEVDA